MVQATQDQLAWRERFAQLRRGLADKFARRSRSRDERIQELCAACDAAAIKIQK